MQSNLKFQSLPIADDNQKLEVVVDENEQVTLKLSTWTEGLGWCGQKTLSFDAEMIDDLHRALTAARLKMNRQRVQNGENVKTSKILAFPMAA